MRTIFSGLWFLMVLNLTACLPAYLQKYRTEEVVDSPGALRPGPGPTVPEYTSFSSRELPGQASPASQPSPSQSSEAVVMIDRSTFLVKQELKDVWEGTLTVLLKNYNVTIADKSVGVITTEWDSFYLNNKVYRNKLSVRVRTIKAKETELTLFNNVEELQEDQKLGTSAIWLPSDSGLREVGRIVQNLAIALNLPQPKLPDEMIAGSPNPAPARKL